MAKYLLPVLGFIATVALLTSTPFAHATHRGKATVAVVIISACIVAGQFISRGRRPKPAPRRAGYPFGTPPRQR